jgi:hypothetical protein
MVRISEYFMRSAVLIGLIGMSMGMYMGITQDFALAPAHAHLNLLGWVSMSIYAMFYRMFPGACPGVLSVIHFCIAVPAALVMGFGISLIHLGYVRAGMPLTGVGAMTTIAGFLIFTWKVVAHTQSQV